MQEILGGAKSFCEALVVAANQAEDWSESDWDAWGDSYDKHC